MKQFEGALIKMRPCFVSLGTGTIVETQVNSKEQMEVVILWDNGHLSTEKLGDVDVIQYPLPS